MLSQSSPSEPVKLVITTAAGPTIPLTLKVVTAGKPAITLWALGLRVGLSRAHDSLILPGPIPSTNPVVTQIEPKNGRFELATGEVERMCQVQKLLLVPYQSVVERLRASSLFILFSVVSLFAVIYLSICCIEADANLTKGMPNYAAMQHQADLMRFGFYMAALAMLGVLKIHIPSQESEELGLPLVGNGFVYGGGLLLVIKSVALSARLWGKLVATWLGQPVGGFPLWLVLGMVATALALVRAVYLDFVLPAKQKRLLEQTLGRQE